MPVGLLVAPLVNEENVRLRRGLKRCMNRTGFIVAEHILQLFLRPDASPCPFRTPRGVHPSYWSAKNCMAATDDYARILATHKIFFGSTNNRSCSVVPKTTMCKMSCFSGSNLAGDGCPINCSSASITEMGVAPWRNALRTIHL